MDVFGSIALDWLTRAKWRLLAVVPEVAHLPGYRRSAAIALADECMRRLVRLS